MSFESATKTQLLQVALYEDCPLSFKYEALRELSLRWTNDRLPELIKLHAQGLNMSQIAFEMGIDPHTVKNKIKQYGLRRVGA
jgi:DNA-binding NarL/FixJ family response regulator